MKRHLFAFVMLFLTGYLCAADIISGQTYNITMPSAGNKPLTVTNSSLNRDADVTIWTETNVGAQRWIITRNEDNTWQLTNAYTDKILYRRGNASEGTALCQYDKNDLTAGKWEIIPVEGRDGYFFIAQLDRTATSKLYVEAQNPADGTSLTLQTPKDVNQADFQIWRMTAVDAQPTSLTAAMRDELMQKWKERYYKKANVGYVLADGGWWGDAEMFEVVLDAYETTGDAAYEEMFRQLCTNFISRNRADWSYNDFNDDIAWMVIACARAYLMFGDEIYLTYARDNYNMMYDRAAVLPHGMLIWNERENPFGTNSCINGPAEVAACYLAIATGDNKYYEQAKKLYAAQRQYLFVPSSGQVFDSFTWENNYPVRYNHWASSYNQGTYLGAAIMLYNRYGDRQYKEDAQKIMQYIRTNMCEDDIMTEEGTGGDLPGFKGILMRYVRRFIVDLQHPEQIDWMQKNALRAYNNRNSKGISLHAWRVKTPENFIFGTYNDNGVSKPWNFSNNPFGPSSGVSVAFNAPLSKSKIIKDASFTIEAEDFDYIKGIHVVQGTDDNTPELSNIKNGFYTAYYNVDFGSNLARKIEVRVKPSQSGSGIEIRLNNPDGPLIGTVNMPQGSGWQTVTTDITPLDGTQNLYFIYKGTRNQELFSVNHFRFTTDNAIYPDITTNGIISTSLQTPAAQESLEALIDNRMSTRFYTETGAGNTIWIECQTPVPTIIKGYALASAEDVRDKDPKSWKLQASIDGNNWVELDAQSNQQFETRYQKKQYDVTTTTAYRYFRLTVTERNGSAGGFQLAEWQLYGGGLFGNDITADGGTLSAQYTGVEPGDSYTKLTDKDLNSRYLVNSQSNLWVNYKSNAIYKLQRYSITSAGDTPEKDPKDWVLYGSENGNDWIEIDRQVNQKFPYRNITQTYTVQTDAGYQYFRLHILANNGADATQLAEWQLHGKYYYDRLYNDVTTNGGELISSQDSEVNSQKLKALTDNNGNSFYTLPSPSSWVQYKSTMPVQIKGYSITAADDKNKDPRAWTLQGSNDGEQWTNINSRSNISFSMRGERKIYSVSHNTQYTYFRLTITQTATPSDGEVRIAEWELHGNGFQSDDVTSNKGTLTSQYPGVNTNESVSRLIDKSISGKYCADFNGSAWITYQSPTPVKLTAYSLTSAGDEEKRDPRIWVLEASDNGSDWTEIDSRENQYFPYRNTTQYYTCNEDEEEYTHFRLTVTGNYGDGKIQFAEWQLLTIDGAGGSGLAGATKEPFDVVLYPNPAKEYFHIDMPEDGKIEIYSLSGQLLMVQQVNGGQSTIRVADLSSGIYVVRIQSNEQVVSKRIIKR